MSRVVHAVATLLLVACFIAGLLYAPWWIVPVLAALYALFRRARSAPVEAAVAALLATLLLLVRQIASPAFGRLLAQLGEVFPVPGAVVVALSALLAMLLAYSSARVMIGVAGVRDASR